MKAMLITLFMSIAILFNLLIISTEKDIEIDY